MIASPLYYFCRMAGKTNQDTLAWSVIIYITIIYKRPYQHLFHIDSNKKLSYKLLPVWVLLHPRCSSSRILHTHRLPVPHRLYSTLIFQSTQYLDMYIRLFHFDGAIQYPFCKILCINYNRFIHFKSFQKMKSAFKTPIIVSQIPLLDWLSQKHPPINIRTNIDQRLGG